MRCSVFRALQWYLSWGKCTCPEHIFRGLQSLSFAEDISSHQLAGGNWQEGRSRGKCSCLKEKEKGRKSTLRLNSRGVLKLWPKRGGKKKDYKYHRNPCLKNVLHNHKSWEWTASKHSVLLKQCNQSECKEYHFYLCPGVMLSSLTPDMEIKGISTALTWTSMDKWQLTRTEGISPGIIPYFNCGSP